MNGTDLLMATGSALAGATLVGVGLTGAPPEALATSVGGAAGAAIGAVAGVYYYSTTDMSQKGIVQSAGMSGMALVGGAAVVGLASGSWDMVTVGLAAGAAGGIYAVQYYQTQM